MSATALAALKNNAAAPALLRTRDALMRSRAVQRAVRTGTLRGYIPQHVWEHLRPTGVWTVHAPDGAPFWYACDPDDVLAGVVVWSDLAVWEEETHPLLHQLARTARGFLDAGAYAGLYTLLACRANPRLRAVAVEPNPVAQRILRRNIAVNALEDRVRVVPKALSDAPGTARLALPPRITMASLERTADSTHGVDVPVTTGDQAVGEQPIDLVKIDVEGFEPQVLRGLARTLERDRPVLFTECLDARALEQVTATAREFGYTWVRHLGPEGPAPVSPGMSPTAHHRNFLLATGPVPGAGRA
ncbi:FkbM family methyltransferase [Streptomyces sp. YC504]|uniref:FkbM family methyltransferase n=1 Tax=Streptomyces mesophilus TaxID=1775132 RepID=A0A6G4XHW5_9ACTN|nr:FkbM family methyltransferase [Streptomyces mesophilus]NGO76231.1 FkbM family methyltransferase [Streptomyces mesophilus]